MDAPRESRELQAPLGGFLLVILLCWVPEGSRVGALGNPLGDTPMGSLRDPVRDPWGIRQAISWGYLGDNFGDPSRGDAFWVSLGSSRDSLRRPSWVIP